MNKINVVCNCEPYRPGNVDRPVHKEFHQFLCENSYYSCEFSDHADVYRCHFDCGVAVEVRPRTTFGLPGGTKNIHEIDFTAREYPGKGRGEVLYRTRIKNLRDIPAEVAEQTVWNIARLVSGGKRNAKREIVDAREVKELRQYAKGVA